MASLFGRILYPAYHLLKMDGFNRARGQLERNQWLPTTDLLAIQEEKLARLLYFARTNVPYYRALLGDFDFRSGVPISADTFRQVQPLTKEIIRQKRDKLVSEDLTGIKLRPNSTSGSTGEAMRFFTDSRAAAYRTAAEIRSDTWTGWSLGDRYIRLWGASVDLKQADRLRGKLRRLFGSGGRVFSSFNLSATKMDEYVREINQFQPVLFYGYPGPLEEFANHCRARGVTFPSLKAIISSAETLWPHQRKAIEETFGVKIFNRYGSREVGLIACECDVHDGFHVSADRVLVEIVDDKGQPCPNGVEGNIVITDLDNFGMPFIRYEIGDRGVMRDSNVRCGCGRGLPLLENVVGRTMDLVRTPDGRSFGGTFWTLLFKTRPGIRQIQIVQERLSGVIIHFVRDECFDDAVLDYYMDRIRQHCGSGFEVQFIEKDSIELTVSGKRRLVVSLLTNQR